MSPAKEHPQRRQPSLSQDIGFVHTTPSMARTSVELSRPLSPASEPHHASLSFPKSEGKPATATPSDSPTSGFPGYNSEEAYVDAKVKHSDWVYEHVLQHMDWDAQIAGPPPKPFSPRYFLQPTIGPRYEPDDLGPSRDATFCLDDGSFAPSTAVHIPSEEWFKKLETWAEDQGEFGRLCPDIFWVHGERVLGETLMVDDREEWEIYAQQST